MYDVSVCIMQVRSWGVQAYFMLDEMLLAGELQEPSKKVSLLSRIMLSKIKLCTYTAMHSDGTVDGSATSHRRLSADNAMPHASRHAHMTCLCCRHTVPTAYCVTFVWVNYDVVLQLDCQVA